MEEPRNDLDFGAFININMDRAVRRLRAMFRGAALQQEGLSIQEWRALLNLARFGDCHLRELARLASLDATHTGRAALELERKGLIRRSDDEHDGRRKRLRVTNVGHEVVDRVWAKALKLDARVQSRLGKTRYNAVKEALVILLEMPAEEEAMQEVHASE
ncbi:MAG: MarR family winged helix-turn-helix transcriptional regulator [Boseongicola sp.]|nr:MarR family winged helix-turn-helix transcriptional regulator [Boseongicola sp.]